MGLLEGPGFTGWRKLLWSKIEGRHILEVGVGTGRSFPYYPPDANITAIDFSQGMIEKAGNKARERNIRVQLELMDIQHLAFPDSAFDTVVSSLVFCEVSEPLRGLEEIRRVVRWGGKVVMLEHVISDRQPWAMFMNVLAPPIAAITGENINRDTAQNVKQSGLILEKVTRLSSIFRLIESRKERLYFLK